METQPLSRDLSQEYISRYEELQFCEISIPFREFYNHSQARNQGLEFRIIKKITETKGHANHLVENYGNTLSLNRYPDILPYKDTMITPSNTEYMNSSLINGFGPDSGMFIATQAPIKFTTNSFWQLVWENDVPLIIMGCNLIEDDVEKCSPYFPEEEKVTTEDFEVFLIRTQTRFPNLIERKLLLTNPSSAGQRFITHVQFTAWPDLSVPNLNEDFAGIRFLIEKIERKWKKFNGKILVHCSAGVGRTGVIIAIYNMIAEIRAQGTLSVFKTVRVLREQRWGMVATEEQYGFIYRFMEHWVSAYLLQTANEH